MNDSALPLRLAASLVWGGCPTAWEVLSALIGRLDSAQGDAGRAIIGVTRPGSYLDFSLRRSITPHRLFLYPDLPSRAAAPTGREDGFLAVQPDESEGDPLPLAPLPWPAIPHPPVLPRRRLDTLHAFGPTSGDGEGAVGVLAIDAGKRVLTILSGAAGLLEADQPLLLLDLARAAAGERAALWEDCIAEAGPGYAWHDGFLLPAPDARARMLAIEVLGHMVAVGVPVGSRTLTDESGDFAHLQGPLRDMAQVARAARSGFVSHDKARRDGLHIQSDRIAALEGLHPGEVEGAAESGRWTGPSSRTLLRLPVPAPGFWTLTLGVLNWGATGSAADLRVAVNGAALKLANSEGEISRFGPFEARVEDGGSAQLELLTAPPRQASERDPRLFGICLSHLALTPA